MSFLQTYSTNTWQEDFSAQEQTHAITALESGQLLFFPQLAFHLGQDEQRFLSPDYIDKKTKNVSFHKKTDELRGIKKHLTTDERQQLKSMLNRFSEQAREFVENLFPHYKKELIHARTSFRPVEILGRKTSYRKDDTRLHVDAFPATPNQGKRILRVFSNVNLEGKDRIWRLGEPFEEVAKQFLPRARKPIPVSARLLKLLKITKSYRTLYDHYMLQMHDRMKADERYQRNAKQLELRLPPGSSWIVQTDHVSHAAMSGQHMLEQTFYLPVHAMQDENRSPLRVLERLLGRVLI